MTCNSNDGIEGIGGTGGTGKTNVLDTITEKHRTCKHKLHVMESKGNTVIEKCSKCRLYIRSLFPCPDTCLADRKYRGISECANHNFKVLKNDQDDESGQINQECIRCGVHMNVTEPNKTCTHEWFESECSASHLWLQCSKCQIRHYIKFVTEHVPGCMHDWARYFSAEKYNIVKCKKCSIFDKIIKTNTNGLLKTPALKEPCHHLWKIMYEGIGHRRYYCRICNEYDSYEIIDMNQCTNHVWYPSYSDGTTEDKFLACFHCLKTANKSQCAQPDALHSIPICTHDWSVYYSRIEDDIVILQCEECGGRLRTDVTTANLYASQHREEPKICSHNYILLEKQGRKMILECTLCNQGKQIYISPDEVINNTTCHHNFIRLWRQPNYLIRECTECEMADLVEIKLVKPYLLKDETVLTCDKIRINHQIAAIEKDIAKRKNKTKLPKQGKQSKLSKLSKTKSKTLKKKIKVIEFLLEQVQSGCTHTESHIVDHDNDYRICGICAKDVSIRHKEKPCVHSYQRVGHNFLVCVNCLKIKIMWVEI